MKFIKAIALAGVFAFAANAYAQDSYAPESGDFSLEVQFNPFSTDFTTFRIDQLKARWYVTDNDAIRIGLGFGVSNKKNISDPEEASDVWNKTQTGTFSIDLGYERNVYSYKRVNLYAGAGISFALARNTTTTQSEYTMGYTDDMDPIKEIHSVKSYNEGDSYNAFYAKAFTGVDFFVYKGLYLGAELGLKIGVKNFPSPYSKGGMAVDEDGKKIVVDGRTSWDDDYESAKGAKSNGFELSLYAEPAIRLGWQF